MSAEQEIRYTCSVCGYVYGVDVDTDDSTNAWDSSFDDLSDEWCCPICGVGKEMFVKDI